MNESLNDLEIRLLALAQLLSMADEEINITKKTELLKQIKQLARNASELIDNCDCDEI